MSASAWDRAVEAAMEALGGSFYDISPDRAETRHAARDTLAAALPVLLGELAERIENGADGLIRTARQAVEENNKGLARHASIKAEGVRCALGTVRGFAAEVTQ